MQIKLKDRPLPDIIRSRTGGSSDVRPVVQNASPFGLNVRDLDTVAVERLHLPDMIQGVLVTDVDPAGPARLAQIRPNHVILEINRRRVATTAEYRVVVASLKAGEAVAVLIYDRSSGGRVICTLVPDPAQ